jgi:hypothetical protein
MSLYAAIIILSGMFYLLKDTNSSKTDNLYIDDVSNTNKTKIKYIHEPTSVNDLFRILKKIKGEKISIFGQKHSMGGQIIIKNGHAINMKNINKIKVNLKNETVTVGAGILWSGVIKFLNKYGYSPMIVQSYCSFSVGGSISVNAHGIISDKVLGESIIELKIIDPLNNNKTCSRKLNSELFSLIIGGYGLFGVIYEVTLKIIKNVKLNLTTLKLNTNNFVSTYIKIFKNPLVVVKLARIDLLSFDNINLYIFLKNINEQHVVSKLSDNPHEMSKTSQLLYKWIFPTKIGRLFRSIDIKNKTTLNELLYESAKPLCELYSPLIKLTVTHILQEYFVPIDKFNSWMLRLKEYFKNNKLEHCNLLNITIRFVEKDNISFLKYATRPYMFAFVFYFRINSRGETELKKINQDLINYTLKLNGTFYLPYKIHYTPNQLITAYPNIKQFIKYKQLNDPTNRFSNTWFEWLIKKN